MHTTDHSGDREHRLYAALADCLERLEVGEAVSKAELAGKYPEFADEVNRFLANHHELNRLVDPCRETPETLPDDPTEPRRAASGTGGSTDQFADYELLGELGRGGMAVVYKARDRRLDRVVALKMVELPSISAARRFRLEAQLVATLDHIGIVPIYEVGEHDGRPYFTMKLFEGGNLAESLANGKWRSREGHRRAAVLVASIARAVQHAHEHGIFHRDLKPANILLDGAGQPHVADFGLARRMEIEAGLTQSDVVVGTPGYMAPEQALGRKTGLIAADVYALGAIFYELLTGRRVHRAATPLETILQVIERDPIRPRRINRAISHDLETICLKCLERDPEKRYTSAADLADDLTRWLAGEPILARRRRVLIQAIRWVRRHPAVSTLVLGSTATAITIMILFYERWQNAETRAAAIRQLSTVETLLTEKQHQLGEVERDLVAGRHEARNMQESVRSARDLSRREFHARTFHLIAAEIEKEHIGRAVRLLDQLRPESSESDLRGFEWFHLWGRLNHNSQRVAIHEDYVRSIELFPDTQRALTLAGNGDLALWDLKACEAIPSPWRIAGRVTAAGLSPDRKLLAAATDDGTVRFFDSDNGSEKLRQLMPAPLSVMAFSPDGKTLATGAGNGDVALWNIASGDQPALSLRVEMKGHTELVRTMSFSVDGKLIATTSEDKSGIVWSVEKGQLLTKLTSDPARVVAIAFHPSGARLALAEAHPFQGNRDGAVRILDWPSCKTVATSREPLGGAFSVAYSSDGQTLISGGNSGIVRLRKPDTGEVVESLVGHTNRIHALTISSDGRHMLSGGNDRTVRLWTFPTKPFVETLEKSVMTGTTARSADGKTLVTAAKHGRIIKWWNIAAGSLQKTQETDIDFGNWLAISPDGTTLATQTKDHAILLWNSKTRKSKSLSGHMGEVTSLAFSPDGRQLASGSTDGTVRMWNVADLENAHETSQFSHKEGRVYCVRFSPDGSTLAAGTTHDGVTLWDVATGKRKHSLPSKNAQLILAYSPDGSQLASGSWNAEVTIWHLDRKAPPLICEGHSMPVRGLAFAPDGQSVISCGDDQSIKFWDAKSGQERFSISDAHTSAIEELSLAGDGRSLVTLSRDGDVKIWRANAERAEDLFEWHSRRAAECQNNRQWSIAAEHLDWLMKSRPDRWKRFVSAWITVNVELSRWELVADNYPRMLELYPGASDHVKQCAIYQLAAGRKEAYRRICADMIRRAGPEPSSTLASSIIYGTVVLPDSVPDFSTLEPLAQAGVKEHPGGERMLAATLCRAGRHKQALEQLEVARKVWPLRAWDWLFMAISHHHLKQDRQAAECLASARRWISMADELHAKGQSSTWDKSWFNPPERIEVRLLEVEVEDLLKSAAH